MSNIIQPTYGTKTYRVPPKAREATQTGNFWDCAAQTQAQTETPIETQANPNHFLNLAQAEAQANKRKVQALVAGMGSMVGMSSLPTSLMLDLATVRSTDGILTESVETGEVTTPPSLEEMLRVKYPNIHYHVFDASSGYWSTRNDYPHYLLYQDGDMAKQTLENWEPTGENPFYGSIDGRFTAPQAIHALGSVPPASKAVVIHPKVQERMEQDPAYAQEIYAKIDMWFAFDVARNEAILPGSTAGMSQSVAIGEDGNICNACSSSGSGGFTYSRSGFDEEESWWDRRIARHAEMLQLMIQHQQADKIQDRNLAAAAAAKAQLAAMLRNENLPTIFGDEIAGIPTETVLSITQTQVWGAVAIL